MRVTVGVGVAVAVTVLLGVAVAVGGAVVVVVVTAGDGLSPELGETPAEPLAVTETEPLAVTEGVKMAGVVVEDADVQPEITTAAMMAMAPQPIAVNRTLRAVPAMVVRTLIEPPDAPVRR